jgi:3',5'-cyclic AMP phosphodiesterase CpdA
MFVLAHLSDLHLAARPPLADLLSKRGLGFINWHRKRKRVHRPDVLEAITRDLQSLNADHIAVTGDLINFSTRSEYQRARSWLETVGPPAAVTVIPGNHDIYVPAATKWPSEFWNEYMRGDGSADGGSFPFVRRRANVALIALSSALPTGPFLATGFLGEPQLVRFAAALEETRGLFRVVLIHHPPTIAGRRHLRRLVDAVEFRRVLAEKGAELVIHGHDHHHSLVWLDGPQRPIPAAGAPSASAQAAHGSEDAAGYNLFHIAERSGGLSCEMIMRQRTADGSVREFGRQTLV